MWRDIPGWEGRYQVSTDGHVRSCTRVVKGRSGPTRYVGRLLKPGGGTYAVVALVETGHGRHETRYVHDLVLLAFVGPKPEGLEVCHGPNGPHDNSLDNLRYDTRSANALDRHAFGTGWVKRGQHPPVLRTCAVCHIEIRVRKRKTALHHLCTNPDCRRYWGHLCEQRKRVLHEVRP